MLSVFYCTMCLLQWFPSTEFVWTTVAEVCIAEHCLVLPSIVGFLKAAGCRTSLITAISCCQQIWTRFEGSSAICHVLKLTSGCQCCDWHCMESDVAPRHSVTALVISYVMLQTCIVRMYTVLLSLFIAIVRYILLCWYLLCSGFASCMCQAALNATAAKGPSMIVM